MSTLLTIGGAAPEVGVGAATLREYERLGLIHPVRDSAGRRLYTIADVVMAREVASERKASRGKGLQRGLRAVRPLVTP
jgi:DNA-binding transcriptional MerR regulator